MTPATAVERVSSSPAGGAAQRVFFGEGCSRAVVRLLQEYQATSIFLVSGDDSYQRSGAAAALEPATSRLAHQRLHGVRPNPTIEDARRAIDAYRSFPADVVIGVGGGSVIDVAKMAAVLGCQPGDPLDYVKGQRPLQQARSCKLVLLPTTAGSGSEATSFAAVYVDSRKHSLDHPTVKADAALVDPLLSASQPPSVAASSALDALSHAVESYWSSRSTAASRQLAAAALQRLTQQLPRLGASPDRYTRSALALAALQAGQAIDTTRTTAAHAFAYPLTARFGVQHGHACALNLSWLFDHNEKVTDADAVDPRGPAFVRQRIAELRRWFGAEEGEEMRPRLQALLAQVHLVDRLGRLGLTQSDLALVIEDAFASNRLGNNPRAVEVQAALSGLRAIL